jgi:phosphocarrier protein
MDEKAIRLLVEINQTASNFTSSIVLRVGNKFIDVKSIVGLSLTLMTSQGFALEIYGPDDDAAKLAMVQIFKKHGISVNVNP